MAYLTQIDTSTLSNQNITSAVLVHTFTNTSRVRKLYVGVDAFQVAGNGDYVLYATVTRAGAGSALRYIPRTTATAASGVTDISFMSEAIILNATDVLRVYITGLAGDTTTPDITTYIWEEFVLTDSSGNVTFSNTSIATVTTLTNAPEDPAGVTTLLSRLSAVRADYLDNLSAGAVALEAGIQTLLGRVIGTLAAGTHNPQSGDVYPRVGAPVGASISEDIAAIQTKLGAPQTSSLADDIDAIKTETDSIQFRIGMPIDTTLADDIANVRAVVDATATDVTEVRTDTENIQSRLPATLTGDGNIRADALKLNGTAPNNLAPGAQMDLVNAPNSTAITAIQNGLALEASSQSLLGRLTATRAGYLDNLSAGAAALESSVQTLLSRIIGTLLPGNHSPQSGDTYPRVGAPTGASVSADIASVQTAVNTAAANVTEIRTDTENIQSRLPTTLTAGGNIMADALKLNGATPNNLSATAVNDLLSEIHGDGTWGNETEEGANVVALTVEDSETNDPLYDILVTIKDENDSVLIDRKRTAMNGIASFFLNSATYKVHVSAIPGYSSLASQTLVVDGDESETYELDPIVVSPPSSISLCRVYGYQYTIGGNPVSNVAIEATIDLPPKVSGNAILENEKESTTTDSDGYWFLDLAKGQVYRFKIISAGINVAKEVPSDADTVNFSTLI